MLLNNIRLLVRVALAISLFVLFFIWAPWLASKPIEQLNEIGIAHGHVPPGAKSFTINHGKIYFRNIGTIAEEPIVFGLLTAAMIINFILLVLSFPREMRGKHVTRNSD